MKNAALYLCYFPITEPLVENQVLTYLRALARRGVTIHLVTFERRAPSPDVQDETRCRLAAAGVHWHWRRYHGWPSLPATLYDVLIGTFAAFGLCLRHGIRLIHARSHVPAAMGLPLRWVLGCRLLFDLRGLMAEEYADSGRWRPGGLKYRLTKAAERWMLRTADAVVVLADSMKAALVDLPAAERRITVIPCCVETALFAARNARERVRQERGWTQGKVLVYAGKLGGWYPAEAMARFFAVFHDMEPEARFQVLTASDARLLVDTLRRLGVPARHYDVRAVPASEIPAQLLAAEAGLFFDARTTSARAVSPTKLAEYLAAGLPVVANAGIGDSQALLEGSGVGVLVRALTEEEYRRSARELLALLGRPEVSARCRAVAEERLSLERVGAPRYVAVYERLLGAPGGP